MKKIVLFLLVATTLFFVEKPKAQVTYLRNNYGVTANLVSATYGNLLDTVGNSGSTHYLVDTTVPGVNISAGYFKTASWNLVATNISGTTTLTATLQHSTDGVNWFTLKDTVYSISGTGSVGWQVIDYGDAYARIKVASSASGSTQIKGSMILRKPVQIQQ